MLRDAEAAVTAHEKRYAEASFAAAEAGQGEYDRLCGVMEGRCSGCSAVRRRMWRGWR